MARKVHIIGDVLDKVAHKNMVHFSVGDKFELFGCSFKIIESTEDYNDTNLYKDVICEIQGETPKRYYSVSFTLGKDGSYDSDMQDLSFTEAERRDVIISKWVIKRG